MVIDEWEINEYVTVRVREDAQHFSFEVNTGTGWQSFRGRVLQLVAARLKWAHTARAEQVRREEAAHIRQELLAEIVAKRSAWRMPEKGHHSEREIGATSAFAVVIAALDRICPNAPGEPAPAASVHSIPGIGPVTVPDPEESRLSAGNHALKLATDRIGLLEKAIRSGLTYLEEVARALPETGVDGGDKAARMLARYAETLRAALEGGDR